jgi:hypothetical protein
MKKLIELTADDIIEKCALISERAHTTAYIPGDIRALKGTLSLAAIANNTEPSTRWEGAERIANALGAAEMLSGPIKDAIPVIAKTLKFANNTELEGKLENVCKEWEARAKKLTRGVGLQNNPERADTLEDCAEEIRAALTAIANNNELEEVFAALSDATVELGMEVGFSWSGKNHLESAKKFITRILAANNTELEGKLAAARLEEAEMWDKFHHDRFAFNDDIYWNQHRIEELRAALAGQGVSAEVPDGGKK